MQFSARRCHDALRICTTAEICEASHSAKESAFHGDSQRLKYARCSSITNLCGAQGSDPRGTTKKCAAPLISRMSFRAQSCRERERAPHAKYTDRRALTRRVKRAVTGKYLAVAFGLS